MVAEETIYDVVSKRIQASDRFNVFFDLLKMEIINYLNLDEGESDNPIDESDLNFLLESSSVLACSSIDQNKELAYRIVVLVSSLFPEQNETIQRISEILLIRLGNFPGLQLMKAKSHSNYTSSLEFEKIPHSFRQEIASKTVLNKLQVKDIDIFLTDFQSHLYSLLSKNRSVSFSAPTSAGKSFLLVLYLIQNILTRDNFRAVYVVPTKALINQVKNDIKSQLNSFDLEDVKVLSSTVSFEFEDFNEIVDYNKCILILTQERLSYFLSKREIDFHLDLLIVDEAQSISDGNRGAILERTIMQTVRRFPHVDVIFSSPLASNPDFYNRFRNNLTITTTKYSPVFQNIIFLDSRRSKDFMRILYSGELSTIKKNWELAKECPNPDKEKVAFLAFHLGYGSSNILYGNRPSDAEQLAEKLCTYIKEDVTDPKIEDFINFIAANVHPDYTLIDCLKKGVAFHYSKMPREIKEKIEELFADDSVPINYLCCTSTLLEGMNLPARNVFINKPRKGMSKNMEKFDFWNLAGRAGRLLKDFYGNIICVDIHKWEGYVPTIGIDNYEIVSSTEDSLINKGGVLREYLEDLNIVMPKDDRELMEQSASTFILGEMLQENTIRNFIDSRKIEIDESDLNRIDNSIKAIVSGNQLPVEIIEKNSAIDPRLQNKLYQHFISKIYVSLLPKYPPQQDFYQSLEVIFHTIDEIFLNKSDDKIIGKYIYIANQWIKEESLIVLIASEIDFRQKRNNFKSVNSCVNYIVDILDHTLSFKYSKYLKCYHDILEFHLNEINVDSTNNYNLATYLEFGAYKPTTLSLLSFGLSRTTSIRLGRLIADPNLDRAACLDWLRSRYSTEKDALPKICQEDYERNFE